MTHSNNHELTPGSLVTRALALGAVFVGAAIAAEKLATDDDYKHLNAEAKVVSNIRDDGEKATYIIPGCRANGHYIGGMLDPHLAHLGNTHHLAYPEQKFDIESIKAQLLEARAQDRDKPANIYASSMGGVVMLTLLLDEEFRLKFGEIDTFLFDSSPADVDDLDDNTKHAMFASRVIPSSRTVSRVYRSIVRRAAKKLIPHSPEVTDEATRGHQLSSANTHLSAVKGQALFLDRTHFQDNQLVEATQHIKRFVYIGSENDYMVNQESARQRFSQMLGRSVLRVIDWDRDPRSHAAGPEFPKLVAQILSQPPIEGVSPYVSDATPLLPKTA